jgi:hypothetical protein
MKKAPRLISDRGRCVGGGVSSPRLRLKTFRVHTSLTSKNGKIGSELKAIQKRYGNQRDPAPRWSMFQHFI